MLAIRLQRLGRKGYPVYRIAVQEAQRHPLSGRVVAYVGSYNPHTKQTKLDGEKIELYLKHGAQPSPHVIKLLIQEKISLPTWVSKQGKKEKKLRNPDKLRKNRPEEPKSIEKETKPAEVKDESLAEAVKSEKNDKNEAQVNKDKPELETGTEDLAKVADKKTEA